MIIYRPGRTCMKMTASVTNRRSHAYSIIELLILLCLHLYSHIYFLLYSHLFRSVWCFSASNTTWLERRVLNPACAHRPPVCCFVFFVCFIPLFSGGEYSLAALPRSTPIIHFWDQMFTVIMCLLGRHLVPSASRVVSTTVRLPVIFESNLYLFIVAAAPA